jgi:hypothetical protein
MAKLERFKVIRVQNFNEYKEQNKIGETLKNGKINN